MLAKALASYILSSLIAVTVAHAEKLDLESQTILINKIESTLVKLKPSDKSVDQLGLKAQLANLYSEQGRLLIIEEGKLNCDACKGSQKVRQKSVQLYKEVFPNLHGDFRAGVALQLAHLYELLNQSPSAIILYNEIIVNLKQDTSKKFIGKAYVNRGNAYFRQGQFILAQKDFKEALALIRFEEKGSVFHKIAWTYYNQGEIEIAISQLKTLLSQSKYLQQVSSQGYQYSESLHAELSHDLALFMAKSEINNATIKQLVKLTPKSAQIDNLLFLGDECDRLDNAAGAIKVWQFAIMLPEFPLEKKPIVQVKTAKYFREKIQFENAFKQFHQSLEDQILCKTDACTEYQPLAKNYLTSWDKFIKTRSETINIESANALLRSYQDYNNHYHGELQTLMWQAQLARDIGRKQMALEAYHQVADLSVLQKKTKLTEESLLAEIDLAEKLNSTSAKIEAYNHYILLAPQGPQNWLVKFALANTYYDLKKYADAADIYAVIAHQCDCKNNRDSIALKSAHLELDSLAKIEQPEKIETAAKDYATIYTVDRLVFYKIARAAGMKQAFRLANSKEAIDISRAVKKLNFIPMLGATKEESNSYYKLKMQLAELTLDFDTAYKISLALAMDQSKSSVDLIKVLTLAELSNHSNSRLVEKIISMKSSITDKKIAIIIKIRNTINPWPLIEKYAGLLRVDGEMFSDLLIEAFNKTKNFGEVEKYTTDSSVVRTSNGASLWRLVFLKKLGTDSQNIKTAYLLSSSDRLLANSFQKRLNLIKQIQQKLRKADQMKDWSAQVISRSIFRVENIKLANEIQKLPIPKSLSANDRLQYQNGLVAQAKPFVNEAVVASQQLERLWQDIEAINALVYDIKNQFEYRMLFVSEARAVSIYAPENTKAILLDAISDAPAAVPSEKQIANARVEVGQDPYNDKVIADLITLEKSVGHKIMVAYLEGRRQSLSNREKDQTVISQAERVQR